MRRMLIDNNNAVPRLRHDVGLVQLRARRAERTIDEFDRRRRLRARIGGRLPRRKRRLRGLAKAGERGRARDRKGRARRRCAPVPAGPRRNVGAQCRHRGGAAGRRRAAALARERLLQRAHDQRAHEPAVAKAHFGLGRMHVDVDLARVELDEQSEDRLAVARQIVRISRAHGPEEELVAHRPSVDEQVLPERVGATERRQCRIALEREAVPAAGNRDGVGGEIGAEDVAKPREPPGRRPGAPPPR